MSIFGQVWLWSLIAFLVGALLTWLLLVLPANKRVKRLERRLAAADEARYEPAPVPAASSGPSAPESEVTPTRTTEYERRLREEERTTTFAPAEPQWERTRTQEPPARLEPLPEPPAQRTMITPPVTGDHPLPPHTEPEHEPVAEPSGGPATGWFDRDSFDQSTSDNGRAEHSPRDREPDPDVDPVREWEEHEAQVQGRADAQSGFQPEPEPEPDRAPDRMAGDLLPGEFEPERDEEEPPAYAFGGTIHDEAEPPAGFETAAESTQVLPKRQPGSQSPRGGFDPPKPIQPSMRSVERREPVAESDSVRGGSLFEPVIKPKQTGEPAPPPPAAMPPAETPPAALAPHTPPAPQPEPEPEPEPEPADRAEPAPSMLADAPPPPPPRDEEVAKDRSVPVGPFGPGSAMPKPGGGQPSPEFTVKASVTALRYCTESSPQFPRMIAEVWFRTEADAERVGFRPLT